MSAIFCHGEEQLQLAKKSAQKAEVLKTDKYLGVYIMQNTIVEWGGSGVIMKDEGVGKLWKKGK